MMHLHGRVFGRLQHFNALPTALQHETISLQDYLTSHKDEVFAKHHTLKLKSVYGVRTKCLLETIDVWIAQAHAGHVTGATEPPANSTFPVAPESTATPTAVPVAKNSGHVTHHVPKLVPPSPHAKTLLDALVLKGFLTRHKEDKHKHKHHKSMSETEDLSFKDTDLLVPLSKAATGQTNPTITVWDLVDGAVFAGCLKRKAGLLEPLTHGKEIYAVVNARCNTLTLFKTDLSRKPIIQLEAASLKVAFDSTHYGHGVKVWTAVDHELLHAATQQQSDALVHALLAVGAVHEKRIFLHDMISPSQLHHPRPAEMNENAAQRPPKRPSLKHKISDAFKHDDDTRLDGDQAMPMTKSHDSQSLNQPMNAP